MSDNLTYLAESKVRVSDTTRNTGFQVSVAPAVLRAIGVKAGETIEWFWDDEAKRVVPKKAGTK